MRALRCADNLPCANRIAEILWLAEAERWSRLTLPPRAALATSEYRNTDGWDALAFLGEMPPEAANAN